MRKKAERPELALRSFVPSLWRQASDGMLLEVGETIEHLRFRRQIPHRCAGAPSKEGLLGPAEMKQRSQSYSADRRSPDCTR